MNASDLEQIAFGPGLSPCSLRLRPVCTGDDPTDAEARISVRSFRISRRQSRARNTRDRGFGPSLLDRRRGKRRGRMPIDKRHAQDYADRYHGGSLGQERLDKRPEHVAALHDLGVTGGGQDSEPTVGEQVEHLGGVVESDEVSVADHEEGRSSDAADLVRGPAGESCTTGCIRSRNGKKSPGFGATAS